MREAINGSIVDTDTGLVEKGVSDIVLRGLLPNDENNELISYTDKSRNKRSCTDLVFCRQEAKCTIGRWEGQRDKCRGQRRFFK